MNRKKIYSIGLASVVLVLFLILFPFSASSASEQNASSIVTETQITTNDSNQQNPAIYGNWIVWEDSRNGNLDIYMYDLFTSRETQITTNGSDQWGPDIYGDRIVWLDKRNSESVPDYSFGGFDVYMYNLSTREVTRISKNTVLINPDASLKVDIDADEIVWGSGGDGISAYNISTAKQSDISSNVSLYNMAFSGNKIAGTDDMDGREGIVYEYDLTTSNLTQITANESAYGGPAIFGNRVVWPDSRNGNNSSGLISICTISPLKVKPRLPPIIQ